MTKLKVKPKNLVHFNGLLLLASSFEDTVGFPAPPSLAGCHWRIGGHTPDLSENWLVETRLPKDARRAVGASLHLAE